MGTKAEFQGVVISDKMDQSVIVAVERRVRHDLYGKIQRRTSKFMAHDPTNDVKVGDVVAIVGSRPLSRRKRWAVVRVVQRARGV